MGILVQLTSHTHITHHPQILSPSSYKVQMEIDLQVKFKSMKIQTTLPQKYSTCEFGGLEKREHFAASQILKANVSSRDVKASMFHL